MSLFARLKSRRGLAAMLALVLAAVVVVATGRSASAADYTVQLDLRVNCTGYSGGPELRLYYEGSDDTTRFKVEGSAIIDGSGPIVAGDNSNSGVIASGGDLDRYFFGLWGDEWWPATTTSTTGTIFWTVFYDTGTIDEPVWTPLPADGSESYDCTPASPDVVNLPGSPNVIDDPNLDGDAHYELPADTDVFDWTLNPDGAVTVVIKTDEVFPDGSSSHTYPAPTDVFNDEDGDKVGDGVDKCLGSMPGATVDANGCSWEQRNDDGDGLVNGQDNCPDESGPVSNGGCPLPVPVTGNVKWQAPNGGILLSCKNGNPAKLHFVLAPAGSKLTSVGSLSLGFKDGSSLSVVSDWKKGAESFFTSVPSGSTLTSVAASATWLGDKSPKLVYASYSCGKK